MITLVELLRREEDNETDIYLYNMDGRWCAFERSAFLASLMFAKTEINFGMYPWTEGEQTVYLPMVEIRQVVLFAQKLNYVSDEEAKLAFGIRTGRWKYWKASMRKKYQR